MNNLKLLYGLKMVLFFLFTNTSSFFAQETAFKAKGGGIDDYRGAFNRNIYPIKVTGIANLMNTTYGLDRVCISIQHKRISDLKVTLMAPDGSEFWLTNRNGGEYAQDYTGTCFRNDGFNGFIFNGSEPFKGVYIPDGKIEQLNNGTVNPNGYWYLIVEDLQGGISGELKYFSLFFSGNPMQPSYKACDLQNIAACMCPTGQQDCKLVPDLIVVKNWTESQFLEFGPTHKRYPRQLRFGVGMANIGNGPLEISGYGEWYCDDKLVEGNILCPDSTRSQQAIYQTIYAKYSDTLYQERKKGGTLYFDDKPGHDHYHVNGWVDYILLKKRWWTKKPKKWKVIGRSEKVSYCLVDSNNCLETNPNCISEGKIYSKANLQNYGLGDYRTCDGDKQGISVGGIDYYGKYYEGQFIQLPINIKNGQYYLFIEVDPNNYYTELNENNNMVLIPIMLKSQG